jgi:hypothetical protein
MTTHLKRALVTFICIFSFAVMISFKNFNEKIPVKEILIKYDVNVNDYTPIVLDAVEKLKSEGYNKILFEKGTYHFYPEKAFEKYTAISNHDNGLRKTAFPILNLKNIVIDGGESEFLFHGKIIPIMIENSVNINIKNLSIDWKRTFNSEMEVVAIDKENKTVDFTISEDYPYQIQNNELIFIGKDYSHSLEMGIYFDPKTNAVVYNAVKYPSYKVFDGMFSTYNPTPEKEVNEQFITIPANNQKPLNITAIEIKPGLIRLKNINGELPELGWFYVAKGYNSENRQVPAVRLYASSQVNIENVNVYHAGGMGLIAEKCENVNLNRFNVRLREGTKRHLSTTADATHFVNCKGLVKIENCLFENQLDDATNIHGTYVEVSKVLSKNKVEVKLGHFQQRDFDFANPNDTLTIVEMKTFARKKDFVLTKIEKVNEKYYQITFNDNVTNDIKVGDLIDNSNWYPEVILRNNKAINNRARGFLIASPKKVLIENNTFSNMMSAILLEASKYSWWYESGNVQDLTISNNTFLDGTYGGGKIALIEVHAQSAGIIKNINITNNKFNSFNPMLLNIDGVKNLKFNGNEINQSTKYPILYKPAALLNFYNCQDVSIFENKINGFKDFPLVNGNIVDDKFIANFDKPNKTN